MGVYINGMAMPKDHVRVLVLHPDGRVIDEWGNAYQASLLPPHRRLIDADALKDVQQADADFFNGSSDYGEKCRYDEAINAVANIVNATTIIPAEEG
jgi:hypothetical protein